MHRSFARPASLVAIVALLAAACAGPAGLRRTRLGRARPGQGQARPGPRPRDARPVHRPRLRAPVVRREGRDPTGRDQVRVEPAHRAGDLGLRRRDRQARRGRAGRRAVLRHAAVQRGDRGRLGRPLGRRLGLGGDHGFADEGPVRHPALLLDAGELLRASGFADQGRGRARGQADRRVQRLHPRAVPQGRARAARRDPDPAGLAAAGDVPVRAARPPGARRRQARRLPVQHPGRPGRDRQRRSRSGRSDPGLLHAEDRLRRPPPDPRSGRLPRPDRRGRGRPPRQRQAESLSEQFFGTDYATKAGAFDLASIGQQVP